MKTNKGFTLIELLVVIAIIGILSSVVLASLNTARDKGEDAAIKANLTNIRAQAEIVYDDAPRSYAAVCTDPNVKAGWEAAGGSCDDDDDEWAASAKIASGEYFCVDYTGNATTAATAHGTADEAINCP